MRISDWSSDVCSSDLGLSTPPKPTLANLINLATKPRWCLNMLGTKRRGFGNIVGHAKGVSDLSSLSSWTAEQFDPRLSWNDIEWIRSAERRVGQVFVSTLTTRWSPYH